MTQLTIERIPVGRVNPAPYNPRLDLQPGDPDYEKLKRSLETFGCVEPLVWNRRTGHLVGGHQRFKILLEQGLAEVDVSVVDLPLEREQALNLALNKIQGDWDHERLASLLSDLTTLPDFDVSLTGFDTTEVGQFWTASCPKGAAKKTASTWPTRSTPPRTSHPSRNPAK